jgi:hypothetical protein
MTKPSVAEVLELYDGVKKKYDESDLFSQFKQDEQYYELDFANELLLPDEFKKEGIVLPTARDIVDTCCDNTDIFNVRVWSNRKNESTKSEEEQNLLRKFGLGVLYRNNVESTISPIRVAAKHYWLHGLAIIKDVWDADRYMDKPVRDMGESEKAYADRIDEWRAEHHDSIPIVIKGVNPRNILLDPYNEGETFIFEVQQELCLNVKGMYDKWTNPKTKKISDVVEHISFWTKNYRCELYDREPVLTGEVVEHTYGFIPYVAIDSGLGNMAADGDMKKRYVGILRYVKALLISESRDYSIGDIILKKNAYPWGYLTGAGALGITGISQKFGEYTPLPADVEVHDMVPKLPPDALLTWMSAASSYLASHGAPNAVRGVGESGVRSGADRRLMIAQASTRYQYSNEAFKNGVAKVLSNCARIMKNVVPGDINVWARTPTDEFDIEIKKDKMKEPFTFYVEFAPVSEEDEYRRHDDLERLTKSGLVTNKWARKQMSNVDPQAMELDEEVQKIMADPMVQQIISQYTAGKLMEKLAQKSMAESLKNKPPAIEPAVPGQGSMPIMGQPQAPMMEQPQAPSRQMSPPIPNVAPIGSAQELQNKMKTMRSQKPMTQQGQGGGGNRP